MAFASHDHFDFHFVAGNHLNYLGAPHPEDDDLYLLPFENYSTISFDLYAALMLSKPNTFVSDARPFELL